MLPHSKTSTDRLLVIGHRGAKGHKDVPENTLLGFGHAIKLGVDGIEFDVRLDKSQHLTVIHDATLNRTTNGRGRVSQVEREALRTLRTRTAQQHIPTLDEVFAYLHELVNEGLTRPDLLVNVELKGSGDGLLGRKVATEIRESVQATNLNLLVSSFNIDELRACQDLCPELSVAPLVGWREKVKAPLDWSRKAKDLLLMVERELDTGTINISNRIANDPQIGVKAIRERGYDCIVYGVEDDGRAKELAHLGAKGVISGFPERISHWPVGMAPTGPRSNGSGG